MMQFRCQLFFLVCLAVTSHVNAQSASDSLSRAQRIVGDTSSSEDRFWARSGGEARELSLGAGGFGMLGDSGVKTLSVNPFSVDPLFMLQNPAYASRYPGYIWFDAGIGNNIADGGFGQNFAGTFTLSDAFTAGLVLARSDAVGFSLVNPNIFGELTSLSQNFSFPPPTNTWQAMGSLRLGDASVGLGISYVSSSASMGGSGSDTSSSSSASFHQPSISAGVVWRASDGNEGSETMLDLGGTLLLPSLTSSNSANGGKISVTALALNGRMFIPMSKECYLVPILDWYHEGGSSTVIATPKDLPTSDNYDAGIGVNCWKGGLHIMSGVSFGYYQQTTPAIANIAPQFSKSQTIIPRWTIGVEWPMLRWLTARLGYFASSGSASSTIEESATTTQTITTGESDLYSPLYGVSPSGLTAGASFYIARFNIDATINDETFRSGPSQIFNGSLFGFVTLGYRFE